MLAPGELISLRRGQYLRDRSVNPLTWPGQFMGRHA